MTGYNNIKNKIKTLKSIAKVTKAMGIISATRMKRATQKYQDASYYFDYVTDFLAKFRNINLSKYSLTKYPMKFKNIAIVIVGPSKGFSGSIVSTMAGSIIKNLNDLSKNHPEINFYSITINKYGQKIAKLCHLKNLYHFDKHFDDSAYYDFASIFFGIRNEFIKNNADEIYLAYLDFTSAAIHHPVFIKLLPLQIPDPKPEQSAISFSEILEPSLEDVVEFLLEEYFEKQIYHAILSSSAAEHSIRMATMQNATDNASKLHDDLVLSYNKQRQSLITKQILEVVSYR